MQLVGVIRPSETRRLEMEYDKDGDEAAKAQLEAQVPDGWQLQTLRAVKE